MASRRLHISGLGAGNDADVRQRAEQVIGRIERFGLRRLPESMSVSEAGFAFVSVTADSALDDNVREARKTLSGTTWKGSKLRIGDAAPDWRARLQAEKETAEKPKQKRHRSRSGAVESPTAHNLVTSDHLEWGWKQTSGGHLVRPLQLRPTKPIPAPTKPDPRKGVKPNATAPVPKLHKSSRSRARLLVIDPTRYQREHLSGSLLESDTPSLPSGTVWVCGSPSESDSGEEPPSTVCWTLRGPDGQVLQEEQVPTTAHFRALNSRNSIHVSNRIGLDVVPDSEPSNRQLAPASQLEHREVEAQSDSESLSEDEDDDQDIASSATSESEPMEGTWQPSAYNPEEEDNFSDGYNEQEHGDQSVEGDVSRAVLARLFGKPTLEATRQQRATTAAPTSGSGEKDDDTLFEKPVAPARATWWAQPESTPKADKATDGAAADLFDKPVHKVGGAWWASEPKAAAESTKDAPLEPQPEPPAKRDSSSSDDPSLYSVTSDSSDSNSGSDSESDVPSSSSSSADSAYKEPVTPKLGAAEAPASAPKPTTPQPVAEPTAPIPARSDALPAPAPPAPVAAAPSRRALLLGLASASAPSTDPFAAAVAAPNVASFRASAPAPPPVPTEPSTSQLTPVAVSKPGIQPPAPAPPATAPVQATPTSSETQAAQAAQANDPGTAAGQVLKPADEAKSESDTESQSESDSYSESDSESSSSSESEQMQVDQPEPQAEPVHNSQSDTLPLAEPSQSAPPQEKGPDGEFQTHYELEMLKDMFQPHKVQPQQEQSGFGASFAALIEGEEMDEEMDWGATESQPEFAPTAAAAPTPSGSAPFVQQPDRSAGTSFPLIAPSIPSILLRLQHHRLEGHPYFVPFAYQHQPCAPDQVEQVSEEARDRYNVGRSAWKRRRYEISAARKHAHN